MCPQSTPEVQDRQLDRLRGTARIATTMSPQPPFTDVPDAIEEIRAGHMIIVIDDEDRENEGDLTLAA